MKQAATGMSLTGQTEAVAQAFVAARREARAAAMLDGPFGAVRFLLANLAARGIDASGGLWVSTGAITGVHPVAVGQRVTAQFVGHGEVRCRIVAAVAR